MDLDSASMLDIITIITSVITLVFILENLLIYIAAWDVTMLWIKMWLYKMPGFIRYTAEGQWKFHLAWTTPDKPKRWSIRLKKDREVPYEVIRGSVGVGPHKVSLMLIADENSGAAGIPLASVLEGHAIGATPAHTSALEKANYAEGFMDGFNKTNPEGVFEWVKENWHVVAVLAMVGIVGAVALYDKVISAPAAWNAANMCEQQKAIIVGKLAQCGVDVSDVLGITQSATSVTTTTLKASNTGAVVS